MGEAETAALREALLRAERENRCGDAVCESRRTHAAIQALTGWKEHGDIAWAVEAFEVEIGIRDVDHIGHEPSNIPSRASVEAAAALAATEAVREPALREPAGPFISRNVTPAVEQANLAELVQWLRSAYPITVAEIERAALREHEGRDAEVAGPPQIDVERRVTVDGATWDRVIRLINAVGWQIAKWEGRSSKTRGEVRNELEDAYLDVRVPPDEALPMYYRDTARLASTDKPDPAR